MAHLRLAVVQRQLLRREGILSVGPRVIRFAVGFIERIDHQRPFHLDRLVLLSFIEHQSPAESADGRPARLGQDRVAPHGDDLVRLARLFVFVERPVRPSVAMCGR
jgi:hypothetical protein